MNASAVGKMSAEAKRAYLAGLVDGDGCIMATIERHSEEKFGYRVRVEFKITQKDNKLLKVLNREFKVGCVSCNNKHNIEYTTHDWIVRTKADVEFILEYIKPYIQTKNKQINCALRILRRPVVTHRDLMINARLADTLSKYNVRSKNRKKNFSTMIKAFISPND